MLRLLPWFLTGLFWRSLGHFLGGLALGHTASIFSFFFFFYSKDACAALLEELKLKVQHGAVGYTEGSTAERHEDLSPEFVLVVDGSTLDWALQEELKDDLLELSCGCRAVICCRSTPLQKSQVVRFIRDKLGVMTLAVGE